MMEVLSLVYSLLTNHDSIEAGAGWRFPAHVLLDDTRCSTRVLFMKIASPLFGISETDPWPVTLVRTTTIDEAMLIV